MPLAALLALSMTQQDVPFHNENLNTMVQQSAVLLNNKLYEMNRQDLQGMTAAVDPGVCLVGGILKPGQVLSFRKPAPGSDYHYLIASANHKGAKITFRIKNAAGEIVRGASANDSDCTIITTVRESQGKSDGMWSYEVVNTASQTAPIFVSVLCTRSGSKGLKYDISSLYKCIENLSNGVKDLKAENYGFTSGLPVVAAGLVGPDQRMVMGPYSMTSETAVVAAPDAAGKKVNLYLTNAEGDIYKDAEDQSSSSPYAILSGQSRVHVRLLNTDSKTGFVSYAIMKPL